METSRRTLAGRGCGKLVEEVVAVMGRTGRGRGMQGKGRAVRVIGFAA